MKLTRNKPVVFRIFNNFTQEFGRPLSPIELETINDWLTIDKYSTKIVKLALREAVLKEGNRRILKNR